MFQFNNVALYHAVTYAASAEDAEVISLPTEGEGLALLRSRRMPTHAFLVWIWRRTSTMSKIAFRRRDGERSAHLYSVVCACCPSETYGLEAIMDHDVPEISARLASEFAGYLVDAARRYGVHTYFMRKAHEWERRYKLSWPRAVEASDHRHELMEAYGRDMDDTDLRFIDYAQSPGLSASY